MKKNAMINFLQTIIELCKEANLSHGLKLSEVTQNKNGKLEVIVKNTAKAGFRRMDIKTIVEDKELLNCFSGADAAIITACHYENEKEYFGVKYKIRSHECDLNDSESVFTLESLNKPQRIRKSASEIFKDKNLYYSLSRLDAHKVSYSLGAIA